jgi:hypothetical protein
MTIRLLEEVYLYNLSTRRAENLPSGHLRDTYVGTKRPTEQSLLVDLLYKAA